MGTRRWKEILFLSETTILYLVLELLNFTLITIEAACAIAVWLARRRNPAIRTQDLAAGGCGFKLSLSIPLRSCLEC